MEMHQVRYFLAVSEELNFTRAAERCNVSQPSLTRGIKLLEAELGGPLFNRERANTHLSELGRMVKPYLQDVHDRAQEAKRYAHGFGRLERTPLRLGIMCTIAPKHILGLIEAVQTRHPGVELQIVDAAAWTLHERLVEGDLEVAIYCRPVEGLDERTHQLPLFREQFMIVLHRDHRLANQAEIRLDDLKGERYVNRSNCEFSGYPGGILTKPEVGCSIVYRSDRDDWILAMVAARLGFAFMPEHCVSDPGLIARPLVDPPFWREVALVTMRGRPHTPAVGALVREAMRVSWAGCPALAVGTADANGEDAEA